MRALWYLLFVYVAACEGAVTPIDDGGARDANVADTGERDASENDAAVDAEFRALVAELLAQLDRQAEARCPCQVDDGDFASHEECVAKISGRSSSADCVTTALAGEDSAELRTMIRCQIGEQRRITECLESSSCADAEVGECLQRESECAMSDLQLLTRLFQACPELSLLARS